MMATQTMTISPTPTTAVPHFTTPATILSSLNGLAVSHYTSAQESMPTVCLGLGNNICGNLDPTNPSPFLAEATEISKGYPIERILWTGWTCTIGQSKSRATALSDTTDRSEHTRRLRRYGGPILLSLARVDDPPYASNRLRQRSWGQVAHWRTSPTTSIYATLRADVAGKSTMTLPFRIVVESLLYAVSMFLRTWSP